MIGPRYWSTGIMVRSWDWDQWSVSLEFKDDGFCNHASTEGELKLRYVVFDLTAGIDQLKADAERMGIVWADILSCPTIYMYGDGEDPDSFYPLNWREIVNEQAARLGWQPGYREVSA
jgi:hypothetical protein